MDSPIAAGKVKDIVIHTVLPMCVLIGNKNQIEKDIESLEHELEKKRKKLQVATKEEDDNFEAFMELLELSPLYPELSTGNPTTIQRFAYIVNSSRETVNTREFHTLFRMINDRLHPKNTPEVIDDRTDASSEGSTESTE